MASHGKVLDLFDDRYLNLHDVIGRIEPFPSLVPYEQYVQHMLVYRIDTNHEVYMALLQDLTDRFARQQESKEAWTWCVQWEVEKPIIDAPSTPAVKKQRTDAPPTAARNNELAQRKPPAYTKIERRLLHPDLFQEEDMLRILIDIVQVDSKLVPNYIEFLYQWVDYYQGGGQALKAALRMEIPSLWLFEFHPLPLFNNDSKDPEEDGLDKAAEEMGEKFTKRKKPPALEEMERLTEQSERLQYREVKFGIQRPNDLNDEPLPPLINVPHDHKKRQRYYAACFKNRQRAFWLLQEAGVTARQIANYKKLQPMSPMNTPEHVNGDGWLNYYKEEPCAHAAFLDNQRMKELREKQREIAVSNRLAEEARVAATATPANPSSLLQPALIPPTPGLPPVATSGCPDRVAAWLASVKSKVKKNRDPPIKNIPSPMFGQPKSKVFKHAIAPPPPPPRTRWEESSGEDTDDDDDYSNPDDIDPDERDEEDDDAMDATTHTPAPSQAPPFPVQPNPPSQPGPSALPSIEAYFQSLRPPQLASLFPLLNPHVQATIRRNNPGLFMQNQAPQQPMAGGGAHSPTPSLPNSTPLGFGPQPSVPPMGGSAPPPMNFQLQRQVFIQRLAQMQLPHLSSFSQGGAAYPPTNSQVQARLYLQQAQRQSQGLPPLSPMEAARQAAAQLNLLPAYYGSSHSTGSLPQPGSLPNLPLPPSIQEPNRNAQTSQASIPGAGSLSGQQHLHPARGYTYGYEYNGQMENTAASTSGRIPAITVTQAQSGSDVQGNDVPRTISPALHALLHSSQNVAPTSMTSHGQHQPSHTQLGQNGGSLNISQPIPSTPGSQLLPIPDQYTYTSRSPAVTSFAQMMQASNRAPPPPNLTVPPNLPSRHPPLPAGFAPGSPSPMTPLAGLAGNLSLASPQQPNPTVIRKDGSFLSDTLQAASPHGIPIQIYVPKVVIPHDSNFSGATDCLILGYTNHGTDVIKLSKAIFLPCSIGDNMLRRIQRNHAIVLEDYRPPPNHPRYAADRGTLRNPDDVKGPHKFVHDKLSQIFGLMTECGNREEEVTKRWRVTPGPMTAKQRGSVWEGWGLYVDRPVEMGHEERQGPGASAYRDLDGRMDFGLSEEELAYQEMRKREIDELIAEDEARDSSDEDDQMEE